MSTSQFNGITWLAAIVLALATGCGGSDDTAPAPPEGDSPTTSPQPADDSLQPVRPPVEPESSENPRVEIQTTAGSITVTLDRKRAPRTVENFLSYVDQEFYDGTIIHRVIKDYAILGGNYKMDGNSILLKDAGGVGINNEAADGLSNKRGTIAMARDPEDADSARCQFFFNLVDNTSLDYSEPEDGVPVWQTAGYCAFGTVDGNGMTVLDDIAQKDVYSVEEMNEVPIETITITSIRRL
jgi:cyclophilin family peptidyl-prolyl cis-trans isomerase